jgi:uncharacterized membrane protein
MADRSTASTPMDMNPNRLTALTAGALFIVATAAALLSSAVENPVLTRTDYLTGVSDNANAMYAGGLAALIAAGTSVGIAIALYPVLKRWSAGLALGSVVFRTIEAVMYTMGAVSLLSLLTVGQLYARAASADRASVQAIGDALMGVNQASVLAGVFAFAVGALMYYAVLYRSRLIPQWLSGWGLAGVLLMLGACLSALFTGNPVTSYTILILPIAVQELLLAVWLIAKGFSASALQPHQATLNQRDVQPLARAAAPVRTEARDA